MFNNPCIMTDSYKASHYLQYPPNTNYVYSYIESRGGRWAKTVWFGAQGLIKKHLRTRVTREMVEVAKLFWAAHGEPFNYDGWMYIVEKYKGRIPLTIKAAPEGMVIPTHNILLSVINNDPNLGWLTSWFETLLLRVWHATTVSTGSWYCKQMIMEALNVSSDIPEEAILFALHDFGMRGAVDSSLSGAGHLVHFMGTDNTEGIIGAMAFYDAQMCGLSIPAAEHSSITSWGRENEVEAYRNMLRQFAKPGTMVAVVSDSYDLWNAIDNLWGDKLRQEVIDSGAVVVVRPDSGDPTVVPIQAIQRLDARFGSTVNSKGYRVLKNVKVIQGDGITPDTIPVILKNLLAAGYSAENLAFGMGGGLHTVGIDRDTQKFAMKCSAALVDGTWIDVFKDPATDPGKRSKKGKLALVKNDAGEFETVPLEGNEDRDLLVTIYDNGDIVKDWTFEEVRANAAA
jgi:nicotinamide phosphoribosyltransferase